MQSDKQSILSMQVSVSLIGIVGVALHALADSQSVGEETVDGAGSAIGNAVPLLSFGWAASSGTEGCWQCPDPLGGGGQAPALVIRHWMQSLPHWAGLFSTDTL